MTPEKLCGTEVSKHLTVVYEQRELNRLVVDEVGLRKLPYPFLSISQAHCISEWGNDFRPEYRRLGVFRQRFPDTPIMALTASATPSSVSPHPTLQCTVQYLHRVQNDIVTNLNLSSEHLFKVVHPFNRRNLFYEVGHSTEPVTLAQILFQVRYISQQDTLAFQISEYIKKLHKKRGVPSTGIIYCRTRQTCNELAHFLRGKKLGARPFHKGLS